MTGEARIRVLIADDHPVVRAGLRALISRRPDMQVVAEASTGREALDRFQRHQPDVVLLDLRMPDMDGIETLASVRRLDPAARIVVLTTFGGDEDVYRAMRAGANAYLLKDAPRDELIACIHAVRRGEAWLSPASTAKLATRLAAADLTPREHDVLRLAVAGKSNKEIGATLRMAEGTVKAHLNRIFAKLDVASRTELVAAALRRGFVKPD